MRILVTGGAGFIGGHLAESFVGHGHDVTVLDTLDPYYDVELKQRNIEYGQSASQSGGSYEFYNGDIRDESTVEQFVTDTDVVFHQAAQAGVRTSVENPKKPNDINVGGTLNVLEAARNADVKRIVLASSSSVYGKAAYLPYDEEHPTQPVSPYGVSKLAAEQYARVFYEVYGLPTVSLRYFTVYGPRMRPNMAISNFVARCEAGMSPIVFGDGTQTRDFTYIDDIVTANRTLLTTDAADGEILNIGSTDTIDIQTLAEVVRDAVNSSLEIEYAPRHDADAEHTHADVSKANALVEYQPETDIRDGVRRFIEWYRANEQWYGPLVRGSQTD